MIREKACRDYMSLSPQKRIGALTVLLCWLWFSAAAPFAHQCSNIGEKHLPAYSSGVTFCVACDWAASDKILDSVKTPAVETPHVVSQEWQTPVTRAVQSALLLLPSRAPPALG